MIGRPPKTLAELFEPPSTFRWDRHRHLLRDNLQLNSADVALILARHRVGYLPWQTAAILGLPIGAVGNVLRVHARAPHADPSGKLHPTRELPRSQDEREGLHDQVDRSAESAP